MPIGARQGGKATGPTGRWAWPRTVEPGGLASVLGAGAVASSPTPAAADPSSTPAAAAVVVAGELISDAFDTGDIVLPSNNAPVQVVGFDPTRTSLMIHNDGTETAYIGGHQGRQAFALTAGASTTIATHGEAWAKVTGGVAGSLQWITEHRTGR